jgi:hypothetical protein
VRVASRSNTHACFIIGIARLHRFATASAPVRALSRCCGDHVGFDDEEDKAALSRSPLSGDRYQLRRALVFPVPANPAASRLPARSDPARVTRIADDAQALDASRTLAGVFASGAAERDRNRVLPWTELDLWSQSGLGAITLPRDYGGAGVSFATLAEVFVNLCAADPSLGQIPQNHFGVLGVLREVGTPAQKERLYGEVLAGQRLGNAGPERRSAAAATILQGSTRLRTTPDGLRLDGKRFYSTGALFAHRVLTRAIDDEGRAVQVWVPREAPGLAVVDDWSSFGQRTTASGTVTFDNVPVNPQDVLPIWQLAGQVCSARSRNCSRRQSTWVSRRRPSPTRSPSYANARGRGSIRASNTRPTTRTSSPMSAAWRSTCTRRMKCCWEPAARWMPSRPSRSMPRPARERPSPLPRRRC